MPKIRFHCWLRAGTLAGGLFLALVLVPGGWARAAYAVPEFTAAQLADKAFLQGAIKGEAERQQALETKREKASSLQRAAIDADLKKVAMVLEFLRYVDGHGYRPEDPVLQSLDYMRQGKTISSDDLPPTRVETAPAGEAPKTEAPAAKNESPAEPVVITHGEPVDIERHLVKGKTVIFDFYSEYCPPCRRIAPRLAQLGTRRTDVVVVKVDINRPGVQGIDWNSTVARQYGLRSVPHFIIYSPEGKRIAEGKEASAQVYRMLEQAGL
mgnify:CR=1 FL=1